MIVLSCQPSTSQFGPLSNNLLKRNVITGIEREIVSHVLIGTGAFGSRIVFVLIIFEESDDIVDSVRPGVIGVKPKTFRQIALES